MDRLQFRIRILSSLLATLVALPGCGGGGGGSAGTAAPGGAATPQAPSVPAVVAFSANSPQAVFTGAQDRNPNLAGVQTTLRVSGLPPHMVVQLFLVHRPKNDLSFDQTNPTTTTDSAGNADFGDVTLQDNSDVTIKDSQGATLVSGTTRQNRAPTLIAGTSTSVEVGAAVSLTGQAGDEDGDTLFYSWTRVSGPMATLTGASGATVGFTAFAEGVYKLQLEIIDVMGERATTEFTVTANPAGPVNHNPVANAGADKTGPVGTLVSLQGSATDPDSDTLTYAWTQTAGSNVTLSGASTATASFTPAASGTFTFRLTVTDGRNGSSTDDVTVVISGANHNPTASAGTDQNIVAGTLVTLTGTASDSDGDTLSYEWTQVSGGSVTLAGASSAVATFTPALEDTCVFRLTVSDGKGGTSTSEVTVHIRDMPTANAGSDRTVDVGAVVTLSGSGHDPDADPLDFAWVQTGGATVVLAAANTAAPTFTPAAPGQFTFRLTVTDDNGNTATDDVVLTAVQPNRNPAANAGTDQSVNSGTLVTLNGSATDADGDSLTYIWTQVSGPAATLAGAATRQATFTPSGAGTFVFRLTVSDGRGGSGSDDISVTATGSNANPVAGAGSNQTVASGAHVTLTGSATDADSDPVTYSWTQVSGTTVSLAGASTAVATFTPASSGTYVFRLTVSDGRGGTGTADVTITVTQPNRKPVATAGASQYSVGYDASVTLNGTASADPDGDVLTYKWTESASDKVHATIVNSTSASAMFGTTTIAGGFAAAKMPMPSTYGVMGLPANGGAEYNFTLTVTDPQGLTATSNVLVISRYPSNATTNAALGVPVYFTTPVQQSYAWTLSSKPTGSTAQLFDAQSRNPHFLSDKKGLYKVREGSNADITVNVSGFVGVTTCAGCHADRAADFDQTYHAHKVEYHIDGYRGTAAASHYTQACFKCHTVGYDQSPTTAENGGMDDAITSTGWNFPTTFTIGNFAAMPDEVKAKANVQCESCHGPGGNHFGNKQKIGKAFSVENCGACHSSEPAEWYKSEGHSQVVTSPATRNTCAGCHNGRGYMDTVAGYPATGTITLIANSATTTTTGMAPFACAMCHDPHKTSTPATTEFPKPEERDMQLRLYDRSMKLIDGTVITAKGPSSTCIACHHSRSSVSSIPTTTQTVAKRMAPHHGVQSDVLFGVNGSKVGNLSYSSSPHKDVTDKLCVTCHMAEPAGKKAGQVNEAGGHTWRMTTADGKSNASVTCVSCHEGLTTYDRPATGDYDGNGTTAGIQTEVRGLLTLLDDALLAAAPTVKVSGKDTNAWTYYKSSESVLGLSPDQMKAAWNWKLITEDRSFGVHNAKYIVQLLQRSYKLVTGVNVPGATLR